MHGQSVTQSLMLYVKKLVYERSKISKHKSLIKVTINADNERCKAFLWAEALNQI